MIGGSNRLIGTAEAAEYIGYKRKTVQSEWKSMGLPAIKTGHQLRFRLRDLEAWVEQKAKATAA